MGKMSVSSSSFHGFLQQAHTEHFLYVRYALINEAFVSLRIISLSNILDTYPKPVYKMEICRAYQCITTMKMKYSIDKGFRVLHRGDAEKDITVAVIRKQKNEK